MNCLHYLMRLVLTMMTMKMTMKMIMMLFIIQFMITSRMKRKMHLLCHSIPFMSSFHLKCLLIIVVAMSTIIDTVMCCSCYY